MTESLRVRIVMEEDGAYQPASAAKALTIEQLIRIFVHLDTTHIARVAQVCRSWQIASTDARCWRYLSFSKTIYVPHFDKERLQRLRAQLASMGAKSGNSVESVDFGNASEVAVSLIEGLAESTSSLRYLLCSSRQRGLLDLLALARRCPKLEVLQLRFLDMCQAHWLVNDPAEIVKPRHFSLTTASWFWPGCMPESPDLPDETAALFDHATTLEFKLTDSLFYKGRSDAQEDTRCWMSVKMLARLLKNPAVEELVVHGLWAGHQGVYSISAPSLRFLDLRWSVQLRGNLATLDAPNLRDLAIDGRLLPLLTPASTSSLSSLALRLVELEAEEYGRPEMRVMSRIRAFEGSLKLEIGPKYTEKIVKLLAQDFLWPGLEEVEIELTALSVGAFISIMAARQAGARGATMEQYLDILSLASARLGVDQPRRMTRPLEANFTRQAKDILTAASTFQHSDAIVGPLCSQVEWKISCTEFMPDELARWLEQQPYVHFERHLAISSSQSYLAAS